MRRLILPLLLTCLLLVTFGIAAAVVALRPPPSAWSNTLRLNACELPCWIGITPGETSLEDAVARVEVVFGAPEAYSIEVKAALPYWWKSTVRVRDTGAQFDVLLTRRYPENTIANIDLVFGRPQPTIPELAADIGR